MIKNLVCYKQLPIWTTGGIVAANERKYRFCFPVIITPTLGK